MIQFILPGLPDDLQRTTLIRNIMFLVQSEVLTYRIEIHPEPGRTHDDQRQVTFVDEERGLTVTAYIDNHDLITVHYTSLKDKGWGQTYGRFRQTDAEINIAAWLLGRDERGGENETLMEFITDIAKRNNARTSPSEAT